MKKLFFITLIFLNAALYAAVPVAVMPFEGEDSNASSVQVKVKELLIKTDGLSVVADKQMNDIMKVHEKAQVIGSGYHDISKLKIAEYIVCGNVTDGKLSIQLIDVNSGTEIYNSTVSVTGDSGTLKKTVRAMADKILFRVSSRGGDVPSEAVPYMDVIKGLVSSLAQGDEASYRYIAVYSKSGYAHPAADNPKSADNGKRFLKVVRQDLNRATVTFISMKSDKDWVFVDVIADKAGRQMKYRFGITELADGSLGIGICEESK